MAYRVNPTCPTCEEHPLCVRSNPRLAAALSSIGLCLTLVGVLFLGLLIFDGIIAKTGRTLQLMLLAAIPGIPGCALNLYVEAAHPVKCPKCGHKPRGRMV